jgi:uncharacterized protein YegL
LAERLRDVIDPHDSMPPAALLPPRPARIDARSSRTVPPGTNGTPLRFLLAIDTSASMDGEKSGMVDHAIRELLPQLRERGGENPHTPVTVEVLTFGSRVSWFTRGRVPLRWFDWSGCRVDTRPGLCLDQALQILAASLSDMPGVAPRPTVVVILGSSPTRDVSVALDRILQEPWVRRSVRLGSFVGDDADRDVLSRFIDHPEIEPLEITRLADVVDYLRFEAVRVESTDDVW